MVNEANFARQKLQYWVLVVACVGLLIGQVGHGVQAARRWR